MGFTLPVIFAAELALCEGCIGGMLFWEHMWSAVGIKDGFRWQSKLL